MNGSSKRNANHNTLLLPEIDDRRVVVIGTTTSNKCKIPNTIRNPINALVMCTSGRSRKASHQRPSFSWVRLPMLVSEQVHQVLQLLFLHVHYAQIYGHENNPRSHLRLFRVQ